MTSIWWRRLSSVASRKHPLIQPSKLSQQIFQIVSTFPTSLKNNILTAAVKISLLMFIFFPICSSYDLSLFIMICILSTLCGNTQSHPDLIKCSVKLLILQRIAVMRVPFVIAFAICLAMVCLYLVTMQI